MRPSAASNGEAPASLSILFFRSEPEARSRSLATNVVSGIGELTPVEREAAASDALRKSCLQPFQLGYSLIYPHRPRCGEP